MHQPDNILNCERIAMKNMSKGDSSFMDRGACKGMGPDLFFDPVWGSEAEKAGKRICNKCEVRQECLQFAIDTDQRFGTWGGHTAKERRRVRRKRQQAARLSWTDGPRSIR